MSALMMVEAMKAKVGSSGRKLVLIKLADNANDQGQCWPSYRHIADHCEMGLSTVKEHIKTLAADGYIQIESRNDGKSSNRYTLTIAKGRPPQRARKKEQADYASQPNSDPAEIETSPESVPLTGMKSDPVEIQPGQNLDGGSPESGYVTSPESGTRTCHSFEPVNEPDDEVPSINSGESIVSSDHSMFHPQISGTAEQVIAAHDRFQRFGMHLGWQPSEFLFDRCRAMGVDLSRFDEDLKEQILGEFRSYWEGRGGTQNQGGWEHKFAQQLLRKQQSMASATKKEIDLNDTSWIHGLEEGL